MRIYTRSGDGGDTGLFDGSRVPKEDLRVTAYGDVDELNSLLGMLRAEGCDDELDGRLAAAQQDLFEIGSDLATPGGKRSVDFAQARTQELEAWIDEICGALPALKTFVLPAGSRAACVCHLARTVCRRAERNCWAAHRVHGYPEPLLVYLNRLSDLLFALARHLNARDGHGDVAWSPRG